MGRKPKNEEDAFTYDLRAKVKKSTHADLEAEASARSADKSQIVREAVEEYLAKRKAQREAKARKAKEQG